MIKNKDNGFIGKAVISLIATSLWLKKANMQHFVFLQER